jgi:hypothetical protein
VEELINANNITSKAQENLAGWSLGGPSSHPRVAHPPAVKGLSIHTKGLQTPGQRLAIYTPDIENV